MQVHVLHTFACVSAASAASLTATNPSMKESTKGGGAKRHLLHGWIMVAEEATEAANKNTQILAKHALACTLCKQCLPKPQALNPKPSTQNSKSSNLTSEPKTLKPKP